MEDHSTAKHRASLSRRSAVRLFGGATTALLAGCTADVGEEFPPNTKWPTAELTPGLPVHERINVVEKRIDEMAKKEITDIESFSTAFDEYALEVESVEELRDVLSIEYVNTELYEEGNLHDIAPITGAYAALVDSGYDAVALTITILDAAPASFGSALVATEWAERFNANEFTTKEYGEIVATTIESKRHPPEVGVSPDG